jgi:serine/threonine protein kinase
MGEGGQAHVFEVKDLRNDAPNRVLKRLKNLNRLGRFKAEIEAIERLDHPNVIKLIDYNLDDASPYIVLELLSGGTLGDRIEGFAADPVCALRLFLDICQGVAQAHKLGIVHRDLKPDNILLRTPDGPAVVSDFGICHIEDGKRLTLTEEAVGPRLYIAPELEDGRADQVRPACDVYSLGKVLYSILRGRQVFARERHREDQFDLVKCSGNEGMEHVNRLLDRMIVAEPDRRLVDAAAVVEQVRRVVDLVKYDYRAVSGRRRQRCIYCGEGTYQVVAKDHNAVRNFGFGLVGKPDWRILVCDQCGHASLFRLERAARKDWWAD